MATRLIQHADLQRCNTLALPCEAAALWSFTAAQELPAVLDWCRERGMTPLPLGEGSNVVLPPSLDRAVLRCDDSSVQVLESPGDSCLIRVGAGKNWHALVTELLRRGYPGLENLALIPGSVGAAPVQNIGAYGMELSAVVDRVHGVALADGEVVVLDRDDCRFAYRDSIFKGELSGRFVITAVDFRLCRGGAVNDSYPALAQRLDERGGERSPAAVYEAVISLRRERLPDPAQVPNAGSFFKNPMVSDEQATSLLALHPAMPVYGAGEGRRKLSAAWMIEACGFKGAQRGGAAVSAGHALVLTNRGGSQAELLALAREIQDAVHERFQCELEIEPVVIPVG